MTLIRIRPLSIAVVVLTGFIVIGHMILGLQGIPYNVTELLGENPTIGLAAMGLTPLVCGGLLTGFASLWCQHPSRFAKLFAPAALVIASIVFVALWLVVPGESMADILGAPRLGIGPTLESWLRFLGLFTGPFAAATLGARLGLGRVVARPMWVGTSVLGLLMLVSYVVVVPLAGTNNIVELLRGSGDIRAMAGVVGYLVLVGVVAVFSARGMSSCFNRQFKHGAVAFVCLVFSIPVAWTLFVLATNPQLQKYDQAFSARQFLLSPDRQHYMDDTSILLRFAAVQAGLLILLMTGALVALSEVRVRRATSVKSPPGP